MKRQCRRSDERVGRQRSQCELEREALFEVPFLEGDGVWTSIDLQVKIRVQPEVEQATTVGGRRDLDGVCGRVGG